MIYLSKVIWSTYLNDHFNDYTDEIVKKQYQYQYQIQVDNSKNDRSLVFQVAKCAKLYEDWIKTILWTCFEGRLLWEHSNYKIRISSRIFSSKNA